MERLEGRTAVVTGAASGIGLAVAEAFVAEGMNVVMTDIDGTTLGTHAKRLADEGANVHPVVGDVRDPETLERVGIAAVERFGSLSTVEASTVAANIVDAIRTDRNYV